MPAAARVVLWLFVINLGVALGAGLYESRIMVPEWIGAGPDSALHWDAAKARADDTGLRFWALVTTVPLTLLTLASFAAARRAGAAARRWWSAAAATVLVERALTFGYFIPTMVRLMEMADSPEAVAMATRWAGLNHLRHILILAGLLLALRAFSAAYAHIGSRRGPGEDLVARRAPVG